MTVRSTVSYFFSFFNLCVDYRKLQTVQNVDRVANGPREFVLYRGIETAEEEKDAGDSSALLFAVFRGFPPLHANWNGNGTKAIPSLHR